MKYIKNNFQIVYNSHQTLLFQFPADLANIYIMTGNGTDKGISSFIKFKTVMTKLDFRKSQIILLLPF